MEQNGLLEFPKMNILESITLRQKKVFSVSLDMRAAVLKVELLIQMVNSLLPQEVMVS
jgi:hypothetical protein